MKTPEHFPTTVVYTVSMCMMKVVMQQMFAPLFLSLWWASRFAPLLTTLAVNVKFIRNLLNQQQLAEEWYSYNLNSLMNEDLYDVHPEDISQDNP